MNSRVPRPHMIARLTGLLALPLALMWPLSPVAGYLGGGEAVAQRWCAGCHRVGGNHDGGVALAPPFVAIEARRDIDRDKLALFLVYPHPDMPNIRLTPKEAADLADYILRHRPVKLPIEIPVISDLPALGN